MENQKIVNKPNLKSINLKQELNQSDKFTIFTNNKIYDGFYGEEYPSLEDELNRVVDIDNITNVDQRFFNQWSQPYLIKDLYPKQMQLSTRRSRKCKHCKNFIIKPISKSVLTQFQTKQFHIENTPKLRYRRREEISNTQYRAIVYFYNETDHQLQFKFIQLDENMTQQYKLKQVDFDKNDITLQNKEVKNQSIERITFTITVPQNTREAVSFGFMMDLKAS